MLTTLENSKESNLPPVVFQMSLSQGAEINALLLAQELRISSSKLPKKMMSSSFELGLGDFIFYSILVGKSFTYAGPLGVVCTLLSLIFGLTITVAVLMLTGQAIPAIPIPVTLGLLAQLTTTYLFIPFAFELNSDLILIWWSTKKFQVELYFFIKKLNMLVSCFITLISKLFAMAHTLLLNLTLLALVAFGSTWTTITSITTVSLYKTQFVLP